MLKDGGHDLEEMAEATKVKESHEHVMLHMLLRLIVCPRFESRFQKVGL